jgi:hypothetical protein
LLVVYLSYLNRRNLQKSGGGHGSCRPLDKRSYSRAEATTALEKCMEAARRIAADIKVNYQVSFLVIHLA